ncbi:stonin-2-like isoform X1 [Carassius auratus]|uniref:Stonin-2-like isoform X1 n=1 Tax=Carassius auratus TaxID=7957 RepID=A0A6P6LLV6_CARAU|nr:stonin-2-like isoform X1 [Carassius auratus]XP_026085555.1 stonin-2-like isoform X1 [Carassius auratus]
MAATTSSRTETRPGWVAFSDEESKAGEDHLQALDQPVLDSSTWAEVPFLSGPTAEQPNSWVQFDDKAWPPSLPLPSQVEDCFIAGPRHSICSSASFWSAVPPSESGWTTQSEEQSSVSMGASSCDLPSLNTEEPSSQTPSCPHSPNSSVCQEDEGMNMDSFNWTANNQHTNGQAYVTSNRFASWVTFEDDEDSVFQPPGRQSNIKLDNLNNPPLQDANSNLISSSSCGQKTEGHILGLTPDGTNAMFAFNSTLSNNSVPYNKKNPFLDDEFSNLQPSPINPFSAYFDNTDLKTSQGIGLCQEVSDVSTFSSPFFEYQDADIKRESLLLSSQKDSVVAKHSIPSGFPVDGLDQLRNIHISDPDNDCSPTLPDDSVEVVDSDDSAYKPDHMTPQEGWSMLLRIPEKKNIMSSRHWGPIFVRLTNSGQLQLFYEKGLEKPFKEFQLNSQHEISEPKLQNYDENGRVHTISVDHVVYKEKRKIQPKVTVVHMPVREQVVKLGTTNYQDFLSFQHTLQERLVGLSVDQEGLNLPTTYTEEEIHVEVRDNFYGIVSKGDSRILEQQVMTRVYMLAFLNGSPPCSIGLNDVKVKGKEVVSRHDIIPNSTSRWIQLRDSRLHECADQLEFAESQAITFSPLVGRRFELLRFRTAFAEKSLPFTLRTVACVKDAEVEMQSWLVMSTGFSSNRDPLTLIPCENVAIRYPIPEIWAKNFKRESVTGEKSLKARFNKGASFGSTSTSGSEPAMRVTFGTAKYEQAFRSVVWRISRLPDKNSALGHPHTFFCHLELGSDWEVPAKFECLVEVEFDMPSASASRTTVRSLSVGDRTDLKKWITYKSHYSYQVAVEQKNEITLESPQK